VPEPSWRGVMISGRGPSRTTSPDAVRKRRPTPEPARAVGSRPGPRAPHRRVPAGAGTAAAPSRGRATRGRLRAPGRLRREPGREGGRPHRNGDTARTCASEYTTWGRAIEARSCRLPTGPPARQRIQERVQVGGPSVGVRLAWPSSVRRLRHRDPREHPPQGEPRTPGDRPRRKSAADRALAVPQTPATRLPRGPAA
jgi:hypothetical protein